MSLATQVKMHREAQGYTLSDLSRLAGLARSFIWEIEKGRAEPTASKLILLSRALQVPVGVLLEETPTDAEELKGKHEVWAQGDCVKYVVSDPAVAAYQYRLDMTHARIGISTHYGNTLAELRQQLDVNAAIEAIAVKVHWGWMSEKLAQGFADHPWRANAQYPEYVCDQCVQMATDKPYAIALGQSKRKHHTDMLPYAELPEHIKEYDRKTVRMVFEWLDENGYEVTAKP